MNAAHQLARQRGLTLVELMVGLAVGLIISLAAAALYLGTRESSRATQSTTDINETAKLALDSIGREIQKAGFYPAQYPINNDADKAAEMASFFNAKKPGTAAFDNGLYGCEGGNFNTTAYTCPTPDSAKPDSIVVNYFAAQEFGGSSSIGNATDCNRKAVSADADNATRVAAAPALPLYVSSRFSLQNTTYTTVDGGRNVDVTTKSLSCHGNGNEAGGWEKQFTGIEDMVITYGMYSTVTSQNPDIWVRASSVDGKGTVGGLSPWRRIVAVKICIVMRSLQAARTEEKTGSERKYTNCRGATVTPTDKYIWKRFERIYAVRNNLTG